MKKQSGKEIAKGILAVIVGLSLVLVPYSFLIGWNLTSLLLFWFVIVPLISFYLPAKVSQSKIHLIESLLGLVIFYTLMVFMIYDSFESDYFLVMMVSCAANLIVVYVISLTRKGAQTI